jgi:homospermidine synthase
LSGRFHGRILVLGAGSVSQCALPLLVRHLVDAQQITIMDQLDNRARVGEVIAQGATYVQDTITKENLASQLSTYLKAGDVLLDLAWNIDANAIIGWCHDNGVLYLNTSVEEWEPYAEGAHRPPLERTLYTRHMRLRDMKNAWASAGSTAIVEHGANPGMVSHFVKKALEEIAQRGLKDGKFASEKLVEAALEARDYPGLAHALDVRVIHISERDTQISDKPKQVDEFVNTWSVEGFYEEGIAPAELGWGTHEKSLPPHAFVHEGKGPRNQIAIAQPGATTWVRSWVPECEITGMVIRHGEAFTMSDYLTVWDGDRAIYRPTVHYAYCPSDAAIASMRELEMRQFDLQKNQRIMNEEIIDGEDRLGVLLMGHPYKSWWTGSMLSIHEARKLVPGQSATTLQVAASVYAAVAWMIANPEQGLLVPDELPWEEVYSIAEPYLGPIWSGPADWDPLQTRTDLFAPFTGRTYDHSDPWQFTNFLTQ